MNHEALLYSSEDEYVAVLLPFLREAVKCGEPTVVSTSSTRIESQVRAIRFLLSPRLIRVRVIVSQATGRVADEPRSVRTTR